MRGAIFAAAAAIIACAGTAAAAGAPVQVVLDASGPGGRFDGVGATSGGGATSRLLVDYPEPQRAQILDYLFKPQYGASLHALKVEIGSEGNATEGAEPTHMRTPDEEDYTRGYQWWLMKEAKRRNPDITLHALAWNFPGWVGKANSEATARYLVNFVAGAKRVHGLKIDTLGIWNETRMDPAFIVTLRRALDAAGLDTKIAADDLVNEWTIVDTMERDPAVREAVDIIASHYPRFQSTAKAREKSALWGKPIWSSEDGPWSDSWGARGEQSPPLAELLNRNYIQGRLTSTNIWNLVTAYYDTLELPNAGLMRANRPWSGHYKVMSPLWVVAHTTQFTKPGWRYLDRASGVLADVGSYVTLRGGRNYSVVIETLAAQGPQDFEFVVGEGLSRGPVQVWRSDAQSHFVRIATIRPKAGRYRLRAAANSLYTLSTTKGQGKGAAIAPADAPFPAPFAESFERQTSGAPRYFYDVNGAFEIAPCGAGRAGGCLHQRTLQAPIPWTYWVTMAELGAASLVGAPDWRDYTVSAAGEPEGENYVSVLARVSKVSSDGQMQGYQFRVRANGAWDLLAAVKAPPLASGNAGPGRGDAWRAIALKVQGDEITGLIDGRQVLSIRDSRHGAGQAGVGSGWGAARFDDFAVQAVSEGAPIVTALPAPAAKAPPTQAPRVFVPAANDKAVRLSWSAVPDATRYLVRIGTKPGIWDATVTVEGALEHNFRTLTNGQTYQFEVLGANAHGTGPGATQYATPNPQTPPP